VFEAETRFIGFAGVGGQGHPAQRAVEFSSTWITARFMVGDDYHARSPFFCVCWSGLGIVTKFTFMIYEGAERPGDMLETTISVPPEYSVRYASSIDFDETQSKTERFPLIIVVHIIHISP
jgi:hypothetical protein